MRVAQNLKKIMEQKKISINALERKSGVKPSAVQNIIYGRSKSPGIDTLKSIAKALECSLYDLIDDIESPPKQDFVSQDNWNLDLYISSINSIYNEICEKKIKLSQDNLIFCTNQIYRYSLMSNKKEPDINFVRWILGQQK